MHLKCRPSRVAASLDVVVSLIAKPMDDRFLVEMDVQRLGGGVIATHPLVDVTAKHPDELRCSFNTGGDLLLVQTHGRVVVLPSPSSRGAVYPDSCVARGVCVRVC
jgi:hypothetical protein